MGRESSELHRMEAHIKELQAELDVANANLNTVRRQRRELEAENDRLRATIDELSREFEILDSACDFWKQEAIDRGYEE